MADLRYYTDESLTRAVVRGLRARSIDVLTTHEAGMMGADDREHLRRARDEGRVIVTYDDDFLRHATEDEFTHPTPHAGIVYYPLTMKIGDLIRSLERVCIQKSREEMTGQVVYL